MDVISVSNSTHEKQISEQVCRMYQGLGYTVVREFSIKVGEIPDNRIDVAAVKWSEEGLLQAIAIECKRGNSWKEVGSALNQALAYKTVFRKVYIAAETSADELGHIRGILEFLGIGYIQVWMNEDEPPKELVPPSNKGPVLFDERMSNEAVMHRLGRYAVYESFWGKNETRWGPGEKRMMFFISGMERNHLNYLFHFVDYEPNSDPESSYDYSFNRGNPFIEIGINLESTPRIQQLFTKVSKVDMLEALKKLPDDAVLKVHAFELIGKKERKMPYSSISCDPLLDIKTIRELDLKDVDRLYYRAKENCDYNIWLAVVRRIRLEDISPSQYTFQEEVKNLECGFKPFYDFVSEHVM